MRWIEGGVFTSNMYVLFNGSPTKDFVVYRGLRQAGPLSPFLFALVAEGLTGIMNRVMKTSMFKGFKINEDVSYSLLQF